MTPLECLILDQLLYVMWSIKLSLRLLQLDLREILPYVVSENQSSFIPGRSTVDNILVLQETIHSLKNLKGKKGFMIPKLDLEKAYDRMEWSFVMNSLSCLGIPQDIQNLIFKCRFSSTSLKVNWNGTQTDSFSSTRGLRRGDPISPYLFVLRLERLGHKISNVVASREWIPFSFGRGKPKNLPYVFCGRFDLGV